jgi:uncharacterized protein
MLAAVPRVDKALYDPGLASGFVLKVAGRCNLNCSYCYMYNKGDTSYLGRPKLMAREVAKTALDRIIGYAQRHEINEVLIALHGGEPLLIGRSWMDWFFDEAQQTSRSAGIALGFGVQTNGTLLDKNWIDLLARHEVQIGVSYDGPQAWHDSARLDHFGRGSHRQVLNAVELLRDYYKPRWGVLAVANPQLPAKSLLQHFSDIGASNLDILWPDYHHDDLPPWKPGILGKYFCDLFDFWYDELPSPPRFRWFETAITLLLGGESNIDSLGPNPITDVMVETDGSWEPLDVLRSCENGMTRTAINVQNQDVEAIYAVPLYQTGLHNQELLPQTCRRCIYRNVCGGGYLPHRYSKCSGFANASVHCADLFAVLTHIRHRVAMDLRHLGAAVPP